MKYDRTKHVEVDRHFTKGKIDNGLICTLFVSTGKQLATAPGNPWQAGNDQCPWTSLRESPENPKSNQIIKLGRVCCQA